MNDQLLIQVLQQIHYLKQLTNEIKKNKFYENPVIQGIIQSIEILKNTTILLSQTFYTMNAENYVNNLKENFISNCSIENQKEKKRKNFIFKNNKRKN